jgi:hypothetical protein
MLLCVEIFRRKNRRDLEFIIGGKKARKCLSEVESLGELLAAAASRLDFEHPKRISSSICLTLGDGRDGDTPLLEDQDELQLKLLTGSKSDRGVVSLLLQQR